MKVIGIKDIEYPERLKQIANPPKQLYTEGNIELLKKNSIAVVGTRDCTTYGEKYAREFSYQLSKKGVTIVSGMAVGIDSVAHIHSMEQKGKTIAVLGSGFDHIFPKENQYLYEKILENDGCIVTEYPPEVKVDMANFPRRNRIISGLALGVLVIEARYRSGSTITARNAIKQNKEVFCIPNQVGEPTGYGTNLLIQQGANLVTCVEDILEFYSIFENQKSMEESIVDIKYKKIYELIGQLPISVNEIQRITKKTIAEVTESLCMLELDGFIKNVAGNKYIRTKGK